MNRCELVADLKRRIDSGQYHPPPVLLAQALIHHHVSGPRQALAAATRVRAGSRTEPSGCT